jgi:phytol kinase
MAAGFVSKVCPYYCWVGCLYDLSANGLATSTSTTDTELQLRLTKTAGLLPFATFILVNAALYYTRLLPSVDSPTSSPGTVFFAAVITALFAWLWRPEGGANDMGPIAVAATMAMTLGDAAAALIGSRYGKTRYRVSFLKASVRSYEGSVAMFFVSWFAMAWSLTYLGFPDALPAKHTWKGRLLYERPTKPIEFFPALFVSLFPAVLATCVEAISPFGLDNVFVPLVSALGLMLTTGRLSLI